MFGAALAKDHNGSDSRSIKWLSHVATTKNTSSAFTMPALLVPASYVTCPVTTMSGVRSSCAVSASNIISVTILINLLRTLASCEFCALTSASFARHWIASLGRQCDSHGLSLIASMTLAAAVLSSAIGSAG